VTLLGLNYRVYGHLLLLLCVKVNEVFMFPKEDDGCSILKKNI